MLAGLAGGVALVVACGGNGGGLTDAGAADGGSCNGPAPPEPFESRLTWRSDEGSSDAVFTDNSFPLDASSWASCHPGEIALSGNCYVTRWDGGATNMVYLVESKRVISDPSPIEYWKCTWRNFDGDRSGSASYALQQVYPIIMRAEVLCYRKDAP